MLSEESYYDFDLKKEWGKQLNILQGGQVG